MSDRPSSRTRIPAPRASRPAVGVRARTAARLPPLEIRRSATTIALAEADVVNVASVIAKLPDPADLAPGSLVVVPAELAAAKSLARSVLAVFGRTKIAARTLRCSALVARGYVGVGAADDDDVDLAWGYAPGERAVDARH